MKTFDVMVRVWLKESVFDPQGHAVEHAAHSLGYEDVSGVRIGKTMMFTITAADEDAASKRVESLCATVLCNPVVETFNYELKASVEA